MAQQRKQLKPIPPLKINRAFLDKLYARNEEKKEKIKRLTLNNYE